MKGEGQGGWERIREGDEVSERVGKDGGGSPAYSSLAAVRQVLRAGRQRYSQCFFELTAVRRRQAIAKFK